MLRKRSLVILNGLLWSIAGINVLYKGINALVNDYRWWIELLAIAIGAAFIVMFRGVVNRYTWRIRMLEGNRHPFYQFMSIKGYLLIGFMMTLGITVGHIPGMPNAFFASFYTGLGAALCYGAINFFINSKYII